MQRFLGGMKWNRVRWSHCGPLAGAFSPPLPPQYGGRNLVRPDLAFKTWQPRLTVTSGSHADPPDVWQLIPGLGNNCTVSVKTAKVRPTNKGAVLPTLYCQTRNSSRTGVPYSFTCCWWLCTRVRNFSRPSTWFCLFSRLPFTRGRNGFQRTTTQFPGSADHSSCVRVLWRGEETRGPCPALRRIEGKSSLGTRRQQGDHMRRTEESRNSGECGHSWYVCMQCNMYVIEKKKLG